MTMMKPFHMTTKHSTANTKGKLTIHAIRQTFVQTSRQTNIQIGLSHHLPNVLIGQVLAQTDHYCLKLRRRNHPVSILTFVMIARKAAKR